MVELRGSFRKWWKPPRRTIDRPAERRVTFLELFYDLVFVVLVAELALNLATNPTLAGAGGFAFLFVIIWWAWFNGTSYFELHGNNDIRTRVFTFLQMFTVAAMAVFVQDALGDGSVGFALSFIVFQLVLTYMWWRTGVHDPEHRPLSRPFTLGILLSVLLYAVSVFVPPPWRILSLGRGPGALFVAADLHRAIGPPNPASRPKSIGQERPAPRWLNGSACLPLLSWAKSSPEPYGGWRDSNTLAGRLALRPVWGC